MPELSFRVTGAHGIEHAAAPTLALALEVTNHDALQRVHSVLLHAQVRIDAPARSYSEAERAGLRELFGDPSRWSRTLRGLLWAQTSTVVASFVGKGEAELPDRLGELVGERRRGVLRRSVPHWLEEPELRSMVASFTQAGVRHGGAGALYVELRRSR